MLQLRKMTPYFLIFLVIHANGELQVRFDNIVLLRTKLVLSRLKNSHPLLKKLLDAESKILKSFSLKGSLEILKKEKN
jgi:hypothetical protein